MAAVAPFRVYIIVEPYQRTRGVYKNLHDGLRALVQLGHSNVQGGMPFSLFEWPVKCTFDDKDVDMEHLRVWHWDPVTDTIDGDACDPSFQPPAASAEAISAGHAEVVALASSAQAALDACLPALSAHFNERHRCPAADAAVAAFQLAESQSWVGNKYVIPECTGSQGFWLRLQSRVNARLEGAAAAKPPGGRATAYTLQVALYRARMDAENANARLAYLQRCIAVALAATLEAQEAELAAADVAAVRQAEAPPPPVAPFCGTATGTEVGA